uniref:Uncharacterized protein n=1 Tax=Amphimedon queenslandica TaxID=400682 RepID=A0A1X7UZC9_AMPQE
FNPLSLTVTPLSLNLRKGSIRVLEIKGELRKEERRKDRKERGEKISDPE